MRFTPIVLLSILVISFTNALASDNPFLLDRKDIYIGPEWYHVKRTKEGGTSQQGNLYGIVFGMDRLKRYGWYVGLEGEYAKGKIHGHSGTGHSLDSRLTNKYIEGRFGYTFQKNCGWLVSVTPYLGGGYYIQQNNFMDPSPISAHFKTKFSYVATGFLSTFYLWDLFSIGLNFKAKFPLSPKCHVTHDLDNEPLRQRIGERAHYRIELPFTYRQCQYGASLKPFYDFQNYGSHPNYPFNFIKTQYKNWGLLLELNYSL